MASAERARPGGLGFWPDARSAQDLVGQLHRHHRSQADRAGDKASTPGRVRVLRPGGSSSREGPAKEGEGNREPGELPHKAPKDWERGCASFAVFGHG